MKPKQSPTICNSLLARLLLFTLLLSEGLAQEFTWPQNISNPTGHADYPRLAVDSFGTLFAVWEEYHEGNWDIYFRYSDDGGETFSPIRNLSNNRGSSRNPALATDGFGNIFVVWQDSRFCNEPQILFAYSEDYGESFTTRWLLHVYPCFPAINPSIAVGGDGSINIVYEGQTNSRPILFYARSTDRGRTFQGPRVVWAEPTQQSPHAVTTDRSGNIVLVWGDGRDPAWAFFSRSHRGDPFTQPREFLPFLPRQLSMVTDSLDTMYGVAAYNFGSLDMRLRRSTDGGESFPHGVNIDRTAYAAYPVLAAGVPGTVYLVWQAAEPRTNPARYFLQPLR